eukprot:jgi/Mesen1/1557/ME000134S00668
MAALAASHALTASNSFLASKLDVQKTQLKTSVSQAFGVKNVARVSCSAEESSVQSFVKKCSDASKAAALALMSSAVIAQASVLLLNGAYAEGVPARLTFDELQGKTYSELKGTGIANQCPVVDGGADGFKFGPGKYQLKKLCLEPTSFTVKAENPFSKTGDESYQSTKLMTRLTYTLDEVEGPFTVNGDGSVNFKEVDGIDYAAVTVQLAGGERVPFLFTIKELNASGTPDSFGGQFSVPSYRGSSFLDPKGRGGSTGYDNAVALPAGGRGDEEELEKENTKNTAALNGNITLSVAKSNPETGEIAGIFRSIQPSDTDLGSKAPKDVKIEGIWYAQLE